MATNERFRLTGLPVPGGMPAPNQEDADAAAWAEFHAKREQAKLEQLASEGRTWGEIGADTARGFAASALSVPNIVQGGLNTLGLSDSPPNAVLDKAVEDLRKGKSARSRAQQAVAQQSVEAVPDNVIDRALATVRTGWDNPALVADALVDSSVPMALTMGAGGLVARGALGLGASQGLARTVGTAAGVGTGAAIQGGSVASDTYAKAIKGGATPQQALQAAQIAGRGSAGLSALVNATPAGRTIEGFGARRVAKTPFLSQSGVVRTTGRKALGEGGAEAIEEGGGAEFGNYGQRYIGQDAPVGSGVGEAAGQALMVGGPMGGTIGAIESFSGRNAGVPAAQPGLPASPPVPTNRPFDILSTPVPFTPYRPASSFYSDTAVTGTVGEAGRTVTPEEATYSNLPATNIDVPQGRGFDRRMPSAAPQFGSPTPLGLRPPGPPLPDDPGAGASGGGGGGIAGGIPRSQSDLMRQYAPGSPPTPPTPLPPMEPQSVPAGMGAAGQRVSPGAASFSTLPPTDVTGGANDPTAPVPNFGLPQQPTTPLPGQIPSMGGQQLTPPSPPVVPPPPPPPTLAVPEPPGAQRERLFGAQAAEAEAQAAVAAAQSEEARARARTGQVQPSDLGNAFTYTIDQFGGDKLPLLGGAGVRQAVGSVFSAMQNARDGAGAMQVLTNAIDTAREAGAKRAMAVGKFLETFYTELTGDPYVPAPPPAVPVPAPASGDRRAAGQPAVAPAPATRPAAGAAPALAGAGVGTDIQPSPAPAAAAGAASGAAVRGGVGSPGAQRDPAGGRGKTPLAKEPKKKAEPKAKAAPKKKAEAPAPAPTPEPTQPAAAAAPTPASVLAAMVAAATATRTKPTAAQAKEDAEAAQKAAAKRAQRERVSPELAAAQEAERRAEAEALARRAAPSAPPAVAKKKRRAVDPLDVTNTDNSEMGDRLAAARARRAAAANEVTDAEVDSVLTALMPAQPAAPTETKEARGDSITRRRAQLRRKFRRSATEHDPFIAELLADNNIDGLISALTEHPDPRVRAVAQRLTYFDIDAEVMYGAPPPINRAGIVGPRTLGSYSRGKGLPDLLWVRDGFARASTVLHELTHAAVAQAIRNADDGTISPMRQQALQGILAAYQEAKEKLDAKGRGSLYGLQSPIEFVAEVWGNPDFQNELRAIPPLWKRFVDAVKSFLFGDEPSNLFEQADTFIDMLLRPSTYEGMNPVNLPAEDGFSTRDMLVRLDESWRSRSWVAERVPYKTTVAADVRIARGKFDRDGLLNRRSEADATPADEDTTDRVVREMRAQADADPQINSVARRIAEDLANKADAFVSRGNPARMTIEGSVINNTDRFGRGWLMTMPLGTLVEKFESRIKGLANLASAAFRREAYSTRKATEMDQLVRTFEQLSDRQTLQDVLYDANELGLYPDIPVADQQAAVRRTAARIAEQTKQPIKDVIEEVEARHEALARRFRDDLSDASRAMYRSINNELRTRRDAMQQALRRFVTVLEHDPDARAARLKQLNKSFAANADAPYFPVLRFGEYGVARYDKSGALVEFVLAESAAEQRQAAAMMGARKQEGQRIQQFKQADLGSMLGSSSDATSGLVSDMQSMLAAKVEDPELRGKLQAEMNKLFVSSLPEYHARQRFLPRKFMEGATRDAPRTFGRAILSSLRYEGQLIHNPLITSGLQDISDFASGKPSARKAYVLRTPGRVRVFDNRHDAYQAIGAAYDTNTTNKPLDYTLEVLADTSEKSRTAVAALLKDVAGADLDQIMASVNNAVTRYIPPDTTVARHIENEMRRRINGLADEEVPPVIQFTGNLTYLWHLGFTPAFALINLSQNPLVTLPYMAAKFGMGRTSRAMTKFARQIAADMRGPFKDGWRTGSFDVNKLTSVTPEQKRLLEFLLANNLLDLTQAMDFGRVVDGGGKASEVWQKVMRYGTLAGHYTEVYNRVVAALTAHELAAERVRDYPTEAARFEYVRHVVDRTHLNYSAINRPSVMTRNWATRLMFQFRSYAFGMTHHVLTMVQQALAGETAEVKAEARRALFYSMGTGALAAGARGLPFFSVFVLVASMLGVDDPEEWLLQHGENMTGSREVADMLLRGPGATVLGGDVSERVGLGSIVPFLQTNNMSSGLGDSTFELIFGPSSSILRGYLETGPDHFKNGDIGRAVESMTPKAIRDIMQAHRWNESGLTTKRGDVLIPAEELGVGDLLWKAIGVAPTDVTKMYDRRSYFYELRTKSLDAKNRYLFRYRAAVMLGDYEEAGRVREEAQADERVDIKPRAWQDAVKRQIDRNNMLRITDGMAATRQEAEELRRWFIPMQEAGY